MREIEIFSAVNDEVGEIIVADVSVDSIRALVQPDSLERERLIAGE